MLRLLRLLSRPKRWDEEAAITLCTFVNSATSSRSLLASSCHLDAALVDSRRLCFSLSNAAFTVATSSCSSALRLSRACFPDLGC
eukprot:1194755-Prorocentrum_minimum.AAC.1